MPDRVSSGYQDHNGERRIPEILLILKAPVSGEEDLETRARRAPKKLAVLYTGPALLCNGAYIMAGQFASKTARQLLIEQDSHCPSVPHEPPQAL
ncbi:MAG TPA: hypothetical protein VN754_07100 [Candidatus Binataceae bacterium]|nr:hypothetical protein [Candidatus Binataceae bacterium]